MRQFVALLTPLLLTACAGKFEYLRPNSYALAESNIKTIERPREAVWTSSVPELGKQYFVINNLDKSSGFINVSYAGDPERYVDCGRLTSYVKNAQGERTYDFAGSKAQQSYEIMDPSSNLFFIDRRMNLEGRVNLIFEEVGSNATRVTVNVRYVISRTQIARRAGNNVTENRNDTISFNSGEGASFPANLRGQALECVSTGVLEREILSFIK
jgi:hypothetical protein